MTHPEQKFPLFRNMRNGKMVFLIWQNEVFPDNEQWQKFSHGVISMTEKFKDSIEIGEIASSSSWIQSII
jgi:hypothetical protein